MDTSNRPAPGIFIVRVGLGLVLVAHSLHLKLFVFTLPGTAAFFVSVGLPAALAYAVFVVESVAGLSLIVGYRTRAAAAAVVPILLGASWVHWSNGWLFTNAGGGWEYPALLAVLAVAQVLLGSGAAALSNDAARAASPRRVRALRTEGRSSTG